jgi:lipopolysaccharide export system permease protein
MLYGMMIYTSGSGADNTQIVLADSARMQSTEDHMHLKMTLYSGERFRNMDAQSGRMLKASIPYMRETFVREVDLIPFDNNFSMMDANLFNNNAQTKDLDAIQFGIDSLSSRLDSLGHAFYANALDYYLMRSLPRSDDSITRHRRMEHLLETTEPLDTALARLTTEDLQRTYRSATSRAHSTLAEFEFRGIITENENYSLRTHLLEWQKKFSLSLACLIFFFIGAPLGAIIRKGGLGVPVVVSVLIFIFYYIVNVAGEKMAKQGEWNMLFGAWLSSMVLAPIGAFLVSRANKDSMVFNIEGYRHFFMVVLGLRYSRKIARKEVIIEEPDYPRLRDELMRLTDDCRSYQEHNHLRRFPSYWRLYFRYREDRYVMDISERLERLIEELHNSRDNVIIGGINEYPILVPDAHTRPFHSSRLCIATGLFLPLGIFFWLRVWRFRIRLWRDLSQIQKLSPMIAERIDLHVLSQEISDTLKT